MRNFVLNTTVELEKNTITENEFSLVTFQTNQAKTRYETKEGKQFLVVPCVMMTEGVHQGSMGALYYPESELSKTPAIWNHKPVVVYHPQFNGQSVSACDPIILETYRIGELYNTKWEDGKLKTECWIDEEKANKVDNRVIEAIQNGSMMEVSTGLFTDNEVIEGEWNGENYVSIARNYRPDHLAILPDQIGACSIEDGAGLLRNQQEDTPESRLAESLLKVFNELSHNEIWGELNGIIGDNAWVSDVYDNFFIYEVDEKMFYQDYEIMDEKVNLKGIAQEVEKIIQYRKNDGTLIGNIDLSENFFKKENEMERKKTVDALISNESTPWSEDDREMLMGLSDNKFAIIANEKEETTPAPEEKEVEEKEVEEKAPTDNKEVTLEQYINNAPEGLRDMLRSGLVAHQENKSKLIQKITANKKNTFTPEQLNGKSLDELRQLATLAEVEVSTPSYLPAALFAGQGEVASPSVNSEGVEALEAPVMNFEEK